MAEPFTTDVRLKVLDLATSIGQVPDAHGVADALGASVDAVTAAFARLAEGHVYVLEPGDATRLRMANPFSAVPTPFEVTVGGRGYFGNCVWDALGIVSMLGGSGRLATRCPDCEHQLNLEVANRRLLRAEGVAHFGISARRWWDDIIHT